MELHVPTIIECPHCGEQATINVHVDQEQVIGYFYECPCGNIMEQEEIDND